MVKLGNIYQPHGYQGTSTALRVSSSATTTSFVNKLRFLNICGTFCITKVLGTIFGLLGFFLFSFKIWDVDFS